MRLLIAITLLIIGLGCADHSKKFDYSEKVDFGAFQVELQIKKTHPLKAKYKKQATITKNGKLLKTVEFKSDLDSSIYVYKHKKNGNLYFLDLLKRGVSIDTNLKIESNTYLASDLFSPDSEFTTQGAFLLTGTHPSRELEYHIPQENQKENNTWKDKLHPSCIPRGKTPIERFTVIKDPERIKIFLRSNGFEPHGTWTPDKDKCLPALTALLPYLKKEISSAKDSWERTKLESIQSHHAKYSGEFAGFTVNNKNYIIGNLYTDKIRERYIIKGFLKMYDGGTSNIRIVYDPEAQEVIHLEWNGEV